MIKTTIIFNRLRRFYLQTLDVFIDQVHMKGVDRAVDLTIFDGYNHMITELEKLFDIKGELTFKDNEGDMMLVGDDLWL